jgi:hypothetical protein
MKIEETAKYYEFIKGFRNQLTGRDVKHWTHPANSIKITEGQEDSKYAIHVYGVSHELRSLLRESVPYVKICRYNPKHLCPKLNGYGDNGQRSLKLTAVTRLLITKYILKMAGICGSCNAKICT